MCSFGEGKTKEDASVSEVNLRTPSHVVRTFGKPSTVPREPVADQEQLESEETSKGLDAQVKLYFLFWHGEVP